MTKFDLSDLAALLTGAAVLVYFLFIARYGIKTADESFYLSVPYRLKNGDSLFADEWHVSQLSGVLLLLPLKFLQSRYGFL